MGFIIKYKRFFSVSFGEEGSTDPLAGFRIYPTSECRRKLENYNLVFKQRSYGFEVFYSESPLIPIAERVRFTFGFKIPDAGIFKRYGLVKDSESDPTVYQPGLFFDNLESDGSIRMASPASIVASGAGVNERVTAADTYRVFGQTFKVYDSTTETVPSSYQLSHKYEASLQETYVVTPAAASETVITTINSPEPKENYIGESGPFLLGADTHPSPPHRNIYLNNELRQKSAQGVIDIYWETDQSNNAAPNTGQQYEITFKPK